MFMQVIEFEVLRSALRRYSRVCSDKSKFVVNVIYMVACIQMNLQVIPDLVHPTNGRVQWPQSITHSKPSE